jgi:hypothetical protein
MIRRIVEKMELIGPNEPDEFDDNDMPPEPSIEKHFVDWTVAETIAYLGDMLPMGTRAFMMTFLPFDTMREIINDIPLDLQSDLEDAFKEWQLTKKRRDRERGQQ